MRDCPVVQQQQNYMAVHFKEKNINYNQGHFYRANPYAQQGYIPSSSLKNRKQPQFTTELPQGIDYFEPSAKRHFTDITRKSQIAETGLFHDQEKFPHEYKIATEKTYDRNLNTIDITGANVNSRKPMGIRNRIIAQEQLMRRNAPIITPLLSNGPSEEERCRRLAAEQAERVNSRESELKMSHRKHHSEKKLLPVDRYYRSPYIKMKDEQIEVDMTALEKQLQQQKRKPSEDSLIAYQNPETIKQETTAKRAQTIPHERHDNLYQLLQNKGNFSGEQERRASSNGSRQLHSGSASSSKVNQQITKHFERERRNIEQEYMKSQLRHQYRQFNPTHLSYEASLMKNGSIFSTLGKNLASQ